MSDQWSEPTSHKQVSDQFGAALQEQLFRGDASIGREWYNLLRGATHCVPPLKEPKNEELWQPGESREVANKLMLTKRKEILQSTYAFP